MARHKSGIPALVGSSIAIFWSGAFIFGFPGVIGPYWMSTFQVGRGALGHVMLFVLASVGILMFFVGRWQEKVGIRRMITIGAVLSGLDAFMIIFTTNISMVYLWAFVMGAASCFIYVPGLTTVQRWFPARRGLVTGVFNMMFGLSAAIMPPIISLLFSSLGYRLMTVVLASAALITGTIAALFTAVPEPVEVSGKANTASLNQPLLDESAGLTVGQSVRTKSFWFLWTTWALQGAAGISMITLSTGYGLSKGFSLESSVIILTTFGLSNGVSRLLGGYLSDIVGRTTVMSFTFFASGAAYFALPYVESLASFALLALVIGFAFGTLFAVSAPLAVDCFGILHFGAVFGLVFTAYGFVAGPLGPSLSGYVLDLTDANYSLVFSYLGAFSLISGVLVKFVTPSRPDP